jgi:hypothetical protein
MGSILPCANKRHADELLRRVLDFGDERFFRRTMPSLFPIVIAVNRKSVMAVTAERAVSG